MGRILEFIKLCVSTSYLNLTCIFKLCIMSILSSFSWWCNTSLRRWYKSCPSWSEHPSPLSRTPCRCWSTPSSTAGPVRTQPVSGAPVPSGGRLWMCPHSAGSTRYNCCFNGSGCQYESQPETLLPKWVWVSIWVNLRHYCLNGYRLYYQSTRYFSWGSLSFGLSFVVLHAFSYDLCMACFLISSISWNSWKKKHSLW